MNELPELPQKRVKREAKITPKVLQWFRENHIGACAIEIKATEGGRIPESAVQPHQKLALLAATKEGIVHKIADNKTRTPFDAFMLRGVPAYVVACFISPYEKKCHVIPIEKWSGASHDHDSALFTFTV